MTRQSTGTGLGRRPRTTVHRPRVESLETRQMLSTLATTVDLSSKANRMINGIVTAPVMAISGQTMPDASVHVQVGTTSMSVHSSASGHYQANVAMPSGTYQINVKAQNHAGKVSKASLLATQGDAVLAWVDTMTKVIKADIANVGMASRTMAMVSGAVYDAVNDIERTGSVYKIDVKAPAGASASAAASEAAYTVLSAIEPSMQPLLDVTMAQSLAAVPSASAREAGVKVGLKVAQGILSLRANDGSAAIVPYVPGTQPGQWQPTPPTYQVAWGPEWGQVQTFGITKPASDFVPPPPPALNSPAYAAALNQTESLGALNSTTRTAYQTQTGLFWAYDDLSTGTPPVHYVQVAEQVAFQQHNTIIQNARMFGLVDVVMGDAGIVAWDTKYTYNSWRPITAIHQANTDGNPATVADPNWQPLGSPAAPGQPSFTPPFPSYVSGHATFGQAMFSTLTNFYGTDKLHFSINSDQMPGVVRSYNSFNNASRENAWSRVYLGIHFWFDESAGMDAGRAVANNVFANVMTTKASR